MNVGDEGRKRGRGRGQIGYVSLSADRNGRVNYGAQVMYANRAYRWQSGQEEAKWGGKKWGGLPIYMYMYR